MASLLEEMKKKGVSRYALAMKLGKQPHQTGHVNRTLFGAHTVSVEQVELWIAAINDVASARWNNPEEPYIPLTLADVDYRVERVRLKN